MSEWIRPQWGDGKIQVPLYGDEEEQMKPLEQDFCTFTEYELLEERVHQLELSVKILAVALVGVALAAVLL